MDQTQMTNSGFRSSLTRQFTVADEADFISTNDPYYEERAINEPALKLPFGYQNGRWEGIKAQLQDGDELWEFRSPEWTWRDYVGRTGIVLMRGNEPVAEIITTMS